MFCKDAGFLEKGIGWNKMNRLATGSVMLPNIKLNMDPPLSVEVSRLARLFYTFINPSSVSSCRWAS